MAFLIEPEAGMRETWTYDTDILESRRGTEQRIATYLRPRVRQVMSFEVITEAERIALFELFGSSLDLPQDIPLFAWGCQLTGTALTGTSTIPFNTARTSLADGDRLVLLNPSTGETESFTVNTVNAADAVVAETLSQDVDGDWFAFKGMIALIDNNATLGWNVAAGQFNVTVNSWVEPRVQRTGSAASLTTLDGLPILERLQVEGGDERPEHPREVLDYGGAREISSRFYGVRFNGSKIFNVRRNEPDDVDYWRLFLDTVNGAQKAFLLDSQLSDMTLQTPLVQAGMTMTINELQAYADYHTEAAFQYFRIVYSDGTTSEHQITQSLDTGVVTFTPALPNDPKVTSVRRIGYLMKVRMSDEIRWEHEQGHSRLSFGVTTIKDG